jgi:hypothetical protein
MRLRRSAVEQLTALADVHQSFERARSTAELEGVRARVIGLGALRNEKAQDREDPVAMAKDRADLRTLSRL